MKRWRLASDLADYEPPITSRSRHWRLDRASVLLSKGNCSVKPWKNVRSASSPQRSSHIASVSPLSHQRSGWTTPRTGQPRVLASRETPLHGWRTDHIVPTPRISSPLSAPGPDGGERGTFRRCSVGIQDKPAGGRAHGLTEQLRPRASWTVQWIPVQKKGFNEGSEVG